MLRLRAARVHIRPGEARDQPLDGRIAPRAPEGVEGGDRRRGGADGRRVAPPRRSTSSRSRAPAPQPRDGRRRRGRCPARAMRAAAPIPRNNRGRKGRCLAPGTARRNPRHGRPWARRSRRRRGGRHPRRRRSPRRGRWPHRPRNRTAHRRGRLRTDRASRGIPRSEGPPAHRASGGGASPSNRSSLTARDPRSAPDHFLAGDCAVSALSPADASFLGAASLAAVLPAALPALPLSAPAAAAASSALGSGRFEPCLFK